MSIELADNGRHHPYVLYGDGTVCVTTNGRRIDAKDLHRRLTEKFGPDCADEPHSAVYLVKLYQHEIYSVLTAQEKAPRPLVDVPDERHEPEDWGEVPRWAQFYIADLEDMLGIDTAGTPGEHDNG